MSNLTLPSWYSQEQTNKIANPTFAFAYTLSEERGIKKIGTVSLCHVFAAKDWKPANVAEWAKSNNVFFVFANEAQGDSCFRLQLDANGDTLPYNYEGTFMHMPHNLFATTELVESICRLFPDGDNRLEEFRAYLSK